MKEPVEPFDWQRMFVDEYPWPYFGEIALRSAIMFVILLSALRVSGKRQVSQLSVFELVLVIGLGSAAGDPMFYDDVPLLSAVVVFLVIMTCYLFITRLSDKHKAIRDRLEGVPVYVVEDGVITQKNFDDEDLGLDELFSALRQAGIEHLGQVRVALLEMNGSVSVFQYKPDEVRYGLPILPKELQLHTETIVVAGPYACCHCGHVQTMQPDDPTDCRACSRQRWVRAVR